MRIRSNLFNIIFSVFCAGAFVGCETPTKKDEKDKKPRVKATKENISTIRCHVEAHPGDGNRTMLATVGQAEMVLMANPLISEANVVKAEAWDTTDNRVAIRLVLDRIGRRELMMTSGSMRGARMAVSSQYPEQKWIGVVVFDRIMQDGILTFVCHTPPEDADRIVKGLNIVAAELEEDRDENDY